MGIADTIKLLGKGTIFVVIKSWGEYSDHGQSTIVALSSEEKAKEICKLCNDFSLWLEKISIEKSAEWIKKWNTENKVLPYPHYGHPGYKKDMAAYFEQNATLYPKKILWWAEQEKTIIVPKEFQEIVNLELVRVKIDEHQSDIFSFEYEEVKFMV